MILGMLVLPAIKNKNTVSRKLLAWDSHPIPVLSCAHRGDCAVDGPCVRLGFIAARFLRPRIYSRFTARLSICVGCLHGLFPLGLDMMTHDMGTFLSGRGRGVNKEESLSLSILAGSLRGHGVR